MILMEDLFHTSGRFFAEQLLVIYQTWHTATHIGPSPVLSSLLFTSESTKKTIKNNNNNNINTITIIIKLKTTRAIEHVAKNRMSLSHIVDALCFIVMVAGLCGHSIYTYGRLKFKLILLL
jgi:hypothetical protein